jgi:hypothetical protein
LDLSFASSVFRTPQFGYSDHDYGGEFGSQELVAAQRAIVGRYILPRMFVAVRLMRHKFMFRVAVRPDKPSE